MLNHVIKYRLKDKEMLHITCRGGLCIHQAHHKSKSAAWRAATSACNANTLHHLSSCKHRTAWSEAVSLGRSRTCYTDPYACSGPCHKGQRSCIPPNIYAQDNPLLHSAAYINSAPAYASSFSSSSTQHQQKSVSKTYAHYEFEVWRCRYTNSFSSMYCKIWSSRWGSWSCKKFHASVSSTAL